MIRKDITLDADRPHYYSQFWIDVAMGKREIGAPRTAIVERDVEPTGGVPHETHFADEVEPELELEPPIVRVQPAPKKAEPKKPEPARASLSSLADLAKIDMLMRDSAQMDDDTVPDIENAASAPAIEDEPIATDFDMDENALRAAEEPISLDEQVADEEFNQQFDEEEDDEWGGGPRRGSKPNKRRREPRRDF